MLKQSVEYEVLAFLDDDRSLSDRTLKDLPILHSSEAASAVRRLGVGSVILAMPGLTIRRRREIIDSLLPLPVRLKSIPPLTTVIDDAFRPDKLREVDIEELLGRDPVPPRPRLLEASCRDKVVLVTGAGGSIGSELCRQILANGALRLVLYEMSEFALYSIEAELLAQGGGGRVVPVLGSVRDEDRLRRVLQEHGVETLFHAAAYKHVPMVERNPREGLENNLFGVLHAARAAMQAGVGSFVFISTDKAVRPTNVMGASKRLAEMLLQALADCRHKTRFVMVRFGNVLGSSGSAVPLFRRQIQAGGPVTVTHPDITRYFMTIPEAVELVLQAAAMGTSGDLFVLDMGEPVRILDLARRMIRLSGKTPRDENHPDGVEIVFTGLRPGEKLYEETLIGDVFQPTEHPKIVCVQEEHLPWPAFERVLSRLRFAMDERDHVAIRAILQETVAGYKPFVSPPRTDGRPGGRIKAEDEAPTASRVVPASAGSGR